MRQGRKAASRSEPSSLQDLINNLFSYPYTKVEFIQNVLKVPPRSGPGSSNNRDRGTGPTPPTPPGMRVRTGTFE